MSIKTVLLIGVLSSFAATMQAGYLPDCGHDPGTQGCSNFGFGGYKVHRSSDLGSTYTFAPVSGSGPSITASGFQVQSGSANTVDLYSKGNSGFEPRGDENGLGLVNDHSGDHEITSGSFIMLDLNGLSLSSFYMGSTTDGEEWEIWGSDTAAVAGQPFTIPGSHASGVLTGYSEGSVDASSLAGDPYVFVTSLRGNVLLGGVTACSAAPEPASAGMLGLALMVLGIAARKRFAKNPGRQPARS